MLHNKQLAIHSCQPRNTKKGQKMSEIIPLRLQKETDEDESRYHNKEAANFRQEIINHQIKMFLDQGGKITKLPAYDGLNVTGQTKTTPYARNYKP